MFDFRKDLELDDGAERERRPRRPAPGKVTLTSRLPARPRPAPGDAFAAATSGAGSALPYRATLEQAYGVDFSGLTAHLGTPEARAGLADLGARAAAFGDAIAFAEPDPSLHLVAHEVAHVVQQRQGGAARPQARAVSVGERGDAAELAADRAADAIVRGERAPDVGRADAAAVHLVPVELESAPGDESWTMEIEGDTITIERTRGAQRLPTLQLPRRREGQEGILLRAGVAPHVARAVVEEIRVHGARAAAPLRVSFAEQRGGQSERARRDFIIQRLRSQDNAMAAVAAPVNADRRRSLVMGERAATGGQSLSSTALVFRPRPTHPYGAIPARTERIGEQVVVRPGEFDHRDADGARRTAQVEALGGIEVDENGAVVEVIAYSTLVPGGLQGFVELMQEAGWTVRLRHPPRHRARAVTPETHTAPTQQGAQAGAQPAQPAAQPAAAQPGQADFGPDAPAFLQFSSAAAPAAAAPAPAAPDPARHTPAPDAWQGGIQLNQVAEAERPRDVHALLPQHHRHAGVYRLVPYVHRDDPLERIVYYQAMNPTAPRDQEGHQRADFIMGPQDVATFTSHVTLYVVLAGNFYGFMHRRPEYMIDASRVGYLFLRGRFREGMRALGRSWIEAMQDRDWAMQAVMATGAAIVGVGSASAGASEVAAAEGAEGAAASGGRVRVDLGEPPVHDGRTGVRVAVDPPRPAAPVPEPEPLPPTHTPAPRRRRVPR